LVGRGLYTVPEVARLTGISAQKIHRWTGGYSYEYKATRRVQAPLWKLPIGEVDETRILDFRDLAELRIVDRLIAEELSLHAIRLAMAHARELLGDERPFSTARFRTDGRSIFLEIADEAGDPKLIDLLKRQYGFKNVIGPSLRDLDFDEVGAIRWWPMGRGKAVVVDPSRCFGAPSVAGSSVPTAALAEAFEAEGGSVRRVAALFEVSAKAVEDALTFERGLAA
jgi:uncharacterized protein (DUF433 family)/DNA-binding transcriptional MerR regulator